MRLIDADALKARWYKINDIDEDDRGARFVGYCEIAGMIDNAPTVEVNRVIEVTDYGEREKYTQGEKEFEQVRTGKWIDDDGMVICSECGANAPLDEYTLQADFANYCSNCGAKMDKE